MPGLKLPIEAIREDVQTQIPQQSFKATVKAVNLIQGSVQLQIAGSANWEWYRCLADVSINDILVGQSVAVAFFDGEPVVVGILSSGARAGGLYGFTIHDHSTDQEGGKLDWDDIWADAAHTHIGSDEGGALTWADVWADAVSGPFAVAPSATGSPSVALGDTAVASGLHSVVGGGYINTASATWGTVAGGYNNVAGPGFGCTVGGGAYNTTSSYYATVGGGDQNNATGARSTIAGGLNNTASGYYSTIGGGQHNTASGYCSTVGGGYYNTASGNYAVVCGGVSNTATQPNAAVVGGFSNDVTGNGGFIGSGNANTASGYYTVVGGGQQNTASGSYSVVPGGFWTKADKYGQVAHASGRFAALGDAQGTIQFVARRSVTHSDANWYELFLDGAAQRMTIAVDTAWTFDVLIVGTTSGCAKSFGYRVTGTVKNDGGTTTLLNFYTTIIYEDDTDFDARASADDTNDALLIGVRDSTSGGDTVRWVATIRTAEMTFPA